MSDTGFVPPLTKIGQIVTIHSSPSDEKSTPAIVCKTQRQDGPSRSINVWSMGNRQLYTGCRHRNDPDVKTNPEVLKDSRVVWDISEDTKRLQALEDRVEAQGKVIAELAKMVTELSEKRGPGRPPKSNE